MITDSIIAQGKLERLQYAKLCIVIYYRRPAAIFLTLLGIGVLVYIFFLAGMSESARGSLTLLAFVYAAYILLRPYFIYLNARSYFGTSKNLQENIRYEFTEEKIVTQAQSFKGEKGWDNFYKIVELKHFFLMYHDSRLMNIIPKTFFQNHNDVVKLRELIRVKSHLKQKLRKK